MMRLLGHRGASADFPENTLEAFLGAVSQGADGVELDVMRCGSGEVVVCHDERLDRLAGLQWEVARTPWWKLKQVDVGSTLGFARARIPRLEEVLDALPKDFVINIELKCETIDDRGLAEEVGRLLAGRQETERIFVSSFNPLCLVRLQSAFPHLKRGLLLDPDASWLRQVAWLPFTANASVHPHFSQVTASRVRRWHERGLQVAAWTVDSPDEGRRLGSLGVEWLITNTPGTLRQALR